MTSENFRWARWQLERLHATAATDELADSGPGYCDECRFPAYTRQRYGSFDLCFGCVGRRRRAIKKAA